MTKSESYSRHHPEYLIGSVESKCKFRLIETFNWTRLPMTFGCGKQGAYIFGGIGVSGVGTGGMDTGFSGNLGMGFGSSWMTHTHTMIPIMRWWLPLTQLNQAIQQKLIYGAAVGDPRCGFSCWRCTGNRPLFNMCLLLDCLKKYHGWNCCYGGNRCLEWHWP